MENIGDTFIHLTNTAVQKTSPVYDPSKGTKWSVRSLRLYMQVGGREGGARYGLGNLRLIP